MKENKNRFPIGKVIAIVIIVLAVAALVKPELLFFRSPAQQAVIAQFQQTFFTSYMPVQAQEGGFDVLNLVAVALLLGEC